MNTLTLRTAGESPLYFDLSTRYNLVQSQVESAGAIQVKQRYLGPKSGTPMQSFQAGQLVKVEVQINVPEDA